MSGDVGVIKVVIPIVFKGIYKDKEIEEENKVQIFIIDVEISEVEVVKVDLEKINLKLQLDKTVNTIKIDYQV